MRVLATFWLAVVTALGQAPQIAITHVTVINPGSSSVLTNRMVVIAGDRIASVSDFYLCRSCPYARHCWEHSVSGENK